MKALYELKEHSTAELKVTVDGEKWQQTCQKAFKKIAQNVELKGFRKGKAPMDLIRKAVNPREVWLDAVNLVGQEALEFGLNEYPDIRLVDNPSLDVESISDEEAVLVFGLTIYPEVELGDYKALKYDVARVSVLKEDVEKEIKNLLKENETEVLKEDGEVKNGDVAVIDFEGFKDGVAFDGGKGTEYPLEIGSGSFIPGFEEQIIGMVEGEEKDINVTFPENYGVAELAGQPVVFHVKVDGIKEKQQPELTDEFVAEANIAEGVDTVEKLEKHFKESLRAQRKEEAEEKATNDLMEQLVDCCKVEIPQVMIDREADDTFKLYADRIAQQGITLDLYYRLTGTDEAALKAQSAVEAERRIRTRLVLEAIGKDLQIEATEAELQEQYQALADQYALDLEKVKDLVSEDYVKEDVVMQKTLEELKKINKVEKSKKAAE